MILKLIFIVVIIILLIMAVRISSKYTNLKGNSSKGEINVGRKHSTTNTPSYIALYWYGDTDPSSSLAAQSDTFSYQGSSSYNDQGNISIDFPSGANSVDGKYLIIKFSDSQPTKSIWENGNSTYNNGVIPDQVFRSAFDFSSSFYYATRVPFFFDNSLGTNNVTLS